MEISAQLTTYVTGFTGVFVLLLSLSQLLNRNRQWEHLNLSGLLFCLGVLLLQGGLIVDGTALSRPVLVTGKSTLIFLICPLMFFAYHLIILPVEKLPRRKFLYLLPVIFAIMADIWFFLLPLPEKQQILREITIADYSNKINMLKFVYFLAWIQVTAYLSILFNDFVVIRKKGNTSGVVIITLCYIVVTEILFTILLAGYVFSRIALMKAGFVLISFTLISLYLTGQRYPRLLQLLMMEAEKRSYERSLLGSVDTDIVIDRLYELMERERLYVDDELLMKHLADKIFISPHQLSELLNNRLKTNFNTFVNSYRIREAQQMLADHPEKSVLAIAFEVGFNSKASFYRSFSKLSGQSPQQYRQQHIKNKQ